MRLTLRTLLAYRDAVLPRLEHESLHRRILQNPDAANLLRRINQLVASQEVTPTSLEADGIDSPNVIAGYLDDVLTAPKIAELERVCLQNSGHLCELAQCHQLLAEATRTRVDVPRRLKELAIQLREPQSQAAVRRQLDQKQVQSNQGDHANEVKIAASGKPTRGTGQSSSSDSLISRSSSDVQVNVQTPMLASSGGSIKPSGLNLENSNLSREVPEYLLGSRRRKWQLPLAIAALAILLGGIVWNSLGSLSDLQALWSGQPEIGTTVSATQKQSEVKPNTSIAESEKSRGQSSDSAIGNSAPVKPETKQTKSNSAAPEPRQGATQQTEGETRPAVEQQTSQAPAVVEPEASSPPITPSAPKADPTLETNSMADETVDSVSPQQTPGQSEMRLSLDSAGSSSPFLLAEPTDGRMVLLKDDHSPLTKSRLIAPPSTRSQVESPIWKLTLAGPSVIDVELQGDRLKISPLMLRGLFSCRQVDLPMRVHAAGGVFEVVFRNPSAWLSVEVGHRQISRGSIQEANTYLPVLVMVAGCDQPDASGPLIEINQTDSARSVSLMEPGRGMAVVGDGRQGLEEFALLNPPRWYSKRSISVMQQLAADDLVSGLQAGSENLVQRLREMSNDDRPEVAALAIELSLLLGDPQPFASQLLADDRLRSHWNNTLTLTRQVLSSRRETIEAMGQALTATHGQDSGAELMELLLGLGQERLGGDGLAALIKGLDSQQLPVRVLSAFELQQLTGQSFGYLPHAPIRSSLQQWRQQLNSGKLKIMEVGDPIWERTALP